VGTPAGAPDQCRRLASGWLYIYLLETRLATFLNVQTRTEQQSATSWPPESGRGT